MLYLFNSGYRPKYVKNVLNTLFLPKEGTNDYRYRYRESNNSAPNINPADLEELESLERGTPAVVIFADRFGDEGYRYYPLRRATTVLQDKHNDYLFFRVNLGEFIYPIDIDSFQNNITSYLHPHGILSLTEEEPKNPNDGWYAVTGKNIFAQKDNFYTGSSAWSECVESIKYCKSFNSDFHSSGGDNRSEFIFIRCDIVNNSGNNIAAELDGRRTVYSLTRGEEYELRLSYRYPSQDENTSRTASIDVNVGENLKSLSGSTVKIDSASNTPFYPFTTKKYVEENIDSISFRFYSKNDEVDVYGPDQKLQFKIKESTSFWVQLAAALLIFSISGVYIGADLSNVNSAYSAITTLWDESLAGLVQAGMLFWVFRLVGRRII